MTPPDLHRLLIRPLHETGIEYAITGAVAAIAYGEPRMTNDVDLIARLDRDTPSRLIDRFDAREYYLPPEEVIAEESRRALVVTSTSCTSRPRFGQTSISREKTLYMIGRWSIDWASASAMTPSGSRRSSM